MKAEPRRRQYGRSVKFVVGTVAGISLLAGGITACSSQAASTAVVVDDKQAAADFNITKFFVENVAAGFVQAIGVTIFNDLVGTSSGTDPNTAKLAELTTQLNQVNGKLNALNDGVDTLIQHQADGEYKSDLRAMQAQVGQLEILYRYKFMPILQLNNQLATDIAAGASAQTIESDRKNIAAAVATFKEVYTPNYANYSGVGISMHKYLSPGPMSVLKDKGQVLMAKGYVTSADSTEMRQVYDTWSEYEVVAVMMQTFYENLSNPTTAGTVIADWNGWQKNELANLPPAVPEGHLVTTPNDGSANALEFAPAIDVDPLGQPGDQSDWLPEMSSYTGTAATTYNGASYHPVSCAIVAPTNSPCIRAKQWQPFGGSSGKLPVGGFNLPTNAQFGQLTDSVQRVAGSTASEKLRSAAMNGVVDTGYNSVALRNKIWGSGAFWTLDETKVWIGRGNYGSALMMSHGRADLSGPSASFGTGTTLPSTESGVNDPYSWITSPAWQKKANVLLVKSAPSDYMAQG